jgi:hypothetical protein
MELRAQAPFLKTPRAATSKLQPATCHLPPHLRAIAARRHLEPAFYRARSLLPIVQRALSEGMTFSDSGCDMANKASKRHDASKWTGEPDPVAAEALGIALILGALAFLIVGAFTLHRSSVGGRPP